MSKFDKLTNLKYLFTSAFFLLRRKRQSTKLFLYKCAKAAMQPTQTSFSVFG